MIKANELRIGNCVNIGYDTTILRLMENSCFVNTPFGTLPQLSQRYDEVRPIPLTPELLENCGFMDVSDNKNGLAFRININNCDEFCYYLEDEYLRWQTQGSGFTRPLKHLKFLHQLQNLYFALTGEELEVTL